MYEQNARWNSFYCELDPSRRRQMMEELFMTEGDDGANEYRMRLYEARHGGTRNPREEIDRFLFQFVNLAQVYKSAKLFKRSAKKETLRVMRQLLWTECTQYGEAGERALYWELRNAAMRYFKTCEEPGYNRGLFGLLASGDVSRRERTRQDVWEMTSGLSERIGLKEELRIWNRAVLDAHSQFDSSMAEKMEAGKK